jgi:hypothetical protein
MFDGDVASGPVPHLFTNNPREAKAALSSDPARAFRDLQRIWSKFFIPENLAPGRSWDFLNNIRYTDRISKYLKYSKHNHRLSLTYLGCNHYGPSVQTLS